MGFIWGQKVRGSVRKGRKSSNLFFRNPRKPSHVEFCSESFFIEIPQLSIITELSMPITFFIFVLSWRQTTQKTSKNERGRRAVTACYLLETDVSLFFGQNHTPSIIFEGKTSKCEVSKIFGCCGFLCLQFLSDHISSTHGKSQGKSVWGPSLFCWPVLKLIGSRFSHPKDLWFFSLLQKSPMDLGVFTPTLTE